MTSTQSFTHSAVKVILYGRTLKKIHNSFVIAFAQLINEISTTLANEELLVSVACVGVCRVTKRKVRRKRRIINI